MFSKSQFLDSLDHEAQTVKHLHGKLDGNHLEYRPGEGMRSTLELLQYLSHCIYSPTHALLHDDWAAVASHQEEASKMTWAEFPARMDRQLAQVRALLKEISEEDLESRTVKLPWGTEDKLGNALVNTTLKFASAYRMQLFIYAKAAGLSELKTHNCWLGVDPP